MSHPPSREPRYLIVEDQSVVAADLVETIRERHPLAETAVFADPEDAMAAIAAGAAFDIVFTSRSPETLRDAGIAEAVFATGGRILVFNSSAALEPGSDEAWIVVSRPYTSALIHGVIDRGAAYPT